MRRILPLLLTVAGTLHAQARTFEHPDGFRCKLPRNAKQTTLDPKERIVLGAFETEQLKVWIVRWAKGAGPTTGAGGADAEDPKSFKEQALAAYNRIHSLQELIKARFGPDRYDPMKPSDRKAPKTKDDREMQVFEFTNHDKVWARAYLCDDGVQQFGVIGFGLLEGALERELEQVVRSFELGAATVAPAGEVEIAAGLRNPDYRREVRQRMPQGWEAHDTDNFVLITNVKDKRVITSMLTDLEIMRKCYTERFPPIGPMEKVSLVRVFASYKEYTDYGKLPGALGHFSPLDDELVLFDPGKKVPKRLEWLKDIDPMMVLYHEAMHQYLHEANGLLMPASWFNEGFGEVFGGAQLDRRKGEVRKLDKNSLRLDYIEASQKTKRWPDLRAFVKMTQPTFYGPSVYQNYAFAWAFCYFLEEHRNDPKGNKEWAAIPERYLENLRQVTAEFRADLPENAPKDWILAMQFAIQDKAFERTFKDTDWAELEKAWIAAMEKW